MHAIAIFIDLPNNSKTATYDRPICFLEGENFHLGNRLSIRNNTAINRTKIVYFCFQFIVQ